MIYKLDKHQHLFNKKNGIDKDFNYDTEIIANLPDGYLTDFIIKLKEHPDYETIKDNFIIDEENNKLVQILEKIPNKEMDDLTPDERFFYPLCNKDEIKRIFNIKNADDYFLKFRAENIIDNQRLHRVFSSIRRKNKDNWNFNNYTDSKLFKTYLEILPKHENKVCRNLPHGTVHLNNANGFCMKTPFGNIVAISHALRQFLYYMNIFHFGKEMGIKTDDTFASFILAIRILLGKESLDFEIDSRGEIPLDIHKEIDNITDWQMLFIIGHEYAHNYLSHLDKTVAPEMNFFKSKEVKFYSFKQKDELEADLNSISKPILKNSERSDLADGAFLFFHYLDIFEAVREYLLPSTGLPNSHPESNDRIRELRNNLPDDIGFSKESIESNLEYYSSLKTYLINDFLPFEVDRIETYGSVYLPSYKKELIHDRLLL
jgi:hypothetical protein